MAWIFMVADSDIRSSRRSSRLDDSETNSAGYSNTKIMCIAACAALAYCSFLIGGLSFLGHLRTQKEMKRKNLESELQLIVDSDKDGKVSIYEWSEMYKVIGKEFKPLARGGLLDSDLEGYLFVKKELEIKTHD